MKFTKLRDRHWDMMMAIILIMLTYIMSYYEMARQTSRFLQFGSILFLLFAAFARPRPQDKHNELYEYHYPKNKIFVLLLILSVVMMTRGVISEGLGYHSIVKLVSHPKIFMVYLFPFLLGCSALIFDYKTFYRACTIWTVIFVLIVIISLPQIITESLMSAINPYLRDESTKNIASLVSLISVPLVIVLQREIVPKRIWNISVVNLMVLLFVSLLNARRSSALGVIMVLFFMFLMRKRARWKSILMVFFLVFFMYELGFLDFLLVRGFEDTRTAVIENFYEDMDYDSWIWGRGATGTYFDPMFSEENIEGYRSEIETGYLDLILKGGIIYLATYVICLGYAAFLGLFRSKNAFCSSFGAIILISLFELIPYGIPTWNLKFFSIWMGIAICLNPTLRAMSNEEVKQFLKLE